ncbi:hypothetical protein PIB30_047095 [Stylosanthes scabra]|uniref:Putative plant transposon protein domain-containing protein n=1 Tax=Stylosanthes scabra TaxID=79078 RepID=A0ABU6YFE0_9FABA|nr:hypothetical protein [Stylosanthes scabra]
MAPEYRKRNAQDAPSASHVPDDTIEPTYDAIRTPNVEVPFQLHAAEFPHITAEVERRGWYYLCNPIQGRMGITLLREFYANAKKTKRERALNPPVYISHIRGKELDYSPESLKVILQLLDVDVEGHSYEARKSSNDLRLGDMLRDIARGWLDFVRHSLMPTSNANEVTVERAVLVHSIMEGLSIKAELLISKHISAAAESKDPNKRLPFTGVIYRLLYANGFKKNVQGDELIPIERPITAESIMKNSQQQFPPQVHHQVHEERDQQEQHFQPPPQQFDFPQSSPQNFPQEYNWQELTQQFQGMRQHKYVDEIKASQEITHKAVLELRENQDKHDKELAAHRKEYKKDYKEMKAAMEKSKAQFEAANQYWHQLNSKTEQKIDYLCWGVQQVNPYLKGRLPEDIPEWMQDNVQAGRGRFSDGISLIPRDYWPGATSRGASSASKNVEDKGKGPAEEGDNDERRKKKAWEARDKDLNK